MTELQAANIAHIVQIIARGEANLAVCDFADEKEKSARNEEMIKGFIKQLETELMTL